MKKHQKHLHDDKWHFLKEVDSLDELDRVRRQHQMELETEDEEGIVFKCGGSAHCPYRMSFYHRKSAIYFRHAHSHNKVVPIVGRLSNQQQQQQQMDDDDVDRANADGGKTLRDNKKGLNASSGSSRSSGAKVEQKQQQTVTAQTQTPTTPRNLFSELCISSDEFEFEEEEKEEKREEKKGEKGGEGEEEQQMENVLLEDDDDNDMEEEDKIIVEKEEGGGEGEKEQPKKEVLCGKNSHQIWRPLGKISGAIDEVCREVCQLHFVGKGGGSAKNGNIFFKCPRRKCNYRTMIDTKESLLYFRSSHNHLVPSSPFSPSATVSSPHYPDKFSSLSYDYFSATSSALSSSANAAASSYCDNNGNKWLLIATRVYSNHDMTRFCRAHSLRPLYSRAVRVYLRCARFGNACPYRVIWHRSGGRVYHRQWHNHSKLLRKMTKKGSSSSRQQRHDLRAAQHVDEEEDEEEEDDADKMSQSDNDNSAACTSKTLSAQSSYIDKLGKKWKFLAKLDIFDSSSSRNISRSTATVLSASFPFGQQLEQLCAERHLSRSRISPSSTRIWLHCAQQRQLHVLCPYRVVVHLPEGCVFHRLQHNHPLPYDLSDTEKENGQKNVANGDANRSAVSAASETLAQLSTPISRRPETRSFTKNAIVNRRRNKERSGSSRRMPRRAFVKAQEAMTSGGTEQNGEGEEDADVTESSAADSDTNAYDTDQTDQSADGRPNTRSFGRKLCSTWPKTEVRVQRDAIAKARASIPSGVQTTEKEQPTTPSADGSTTPPIYKFASKNWHFLADKIWHKKALTDFCKENMLRVAGGIITNTYRNRMLCVRSGCPFRALWLNRQGFVYGLRKHNHAMTPKIRPVEKEEPVDETFLKLADLAIDLESLAQRHALHLRIDNDVFVLMLRAEVGSEWFSRVLMLRDDQSSIRLAEFTGCQEEFSEKAEHWLKTDFDGQRKQLIDALSAKCADYFQQQKEGGRRRMNETILP